MWISGWPSPLAIVANKMYGSENLRAFCNTDLSLSVRPSYYLPAVELLWTIITFCFSAVQSTKQVFALRFLVGMLESPFAVGAITLMGSWYTPRGRSLP